MSFPESNEIRRTPLRSWDGCRRLRLVAPGPLLCDKSRNFESCSSEYRRLTSESITKWSVTHAAHARRRRPRSGKNTKRLRASPFYAGAAQFSTTFRTLRSRNRTSRFIPKFRKKTPPKKRQSTEVFTFHDLGFVAWFSTMSANVTSLSRE